MAAWAKAPAQPTPPPIHAVPDADTIDLPPKPINASAQRIGTEPAAEFVEMPVKIIAKAATVKQNVLPTPETDG